MARHYLVLSPLLLLFALCIRTVLSDDLVLVVGAKKWAMAPHNQASLPERLATFPSPLRSVWTQGAGLTVLDKYGSVHSYGSIDAYPYTYSQELPFEYSYNWFNSLDMNEQDTASMIASMPSDLTTLVHGECFLGLKSRTAYWWCPTLTEPAEWDEFTQPVLEAAPLNISNIRALTSLISDIDSEFVEASCADDSCILIGASRRLYIASTSNALGTTTEVTPYGMQFFYEPDFAGNYSIGPYCLSGSHFVAVNKSSPEATSGRQAFWMSWDQKDPWFFPTPTNVALPPISHIACDSSSGIIIMGGVSALLFSFDYNDPFEDVLLTEWIDGQTNMGHSVLQIKGATSSHFIFLMSSGSVFIYWPTVSGTGIGWQLSGSLYPIHETPRVPWPIYTEQIVPSTHKVSQIITGFSYETVYLVATPISTTEDSTPIELNPKPAEIEISHRVPVSFGFPSPLSGTMQFADQDDRKQDVPIAVNLYHLPESMRNFTKVVYGFFHATAITTSGEVLVWGWGVGAPHQDYFTTLLSLGRTMGVPFPLNFPLVHGDYPADVVTCDIATMVLSNNGSAIYWGFLQSPAARRQEQQTLMLNMRQDTLSSFKDPSRPERFRQWNQPEGRSSRPARREAMIEAEDLPRVRGMALTYRFPPSALVRSIHANADTMVVVFYNYSIGVLGKRWVDTENIDWTLPYYKSIYESSFGRPVEISAAKGQFVALLDNQANGGSWNLLHVTTNVQHFCPGNTWFETFPNISYCNMTSANVNIDLSSIKQIVILEDNIALDMLALLHTGQIYHIILTSLTGKRDEEVRYPTYLGHYNPIRHFLEGKSIKAGRKRGIQSTELFDYPGLPPPSSIKKLLAFGSTELQVLTRAVDCSAP